MKNLGTCLKDEYSCTLLKEVKVIVKSEPFTVEIASYIKNAPPLSPSNMLSMKTM